MHTLRGGPITKLRKKVSPVYNKYAENQKKANAMIKLISGPSSNKKSYTKKGHQEKKIFLELENPVSTSMMEVRTSKRNTKLRGRHVESFLSMQNDNLPLRNIPTQFRRVHQRQLSNETLNISKGDNTGAEVSMSQNKIAQQFQDADNAAIPVQYLDSAGQTEEMFQT